MLNSVVLTFTSVNETGVWPFKWKLSWAGLSCCTVYYAIQAISNVRFQVCEWNPNMWPFKWKLFWEDLSWMNVECDTLCLKRWFKVLISLNEILGHEPSNGSYSVSNLAHLCNNVILTLKMQWKGPKCADISVRATTQCFLQVLRVSASCKGEGLNRKPKSFIRLSRFFKSTKHTIKHAWFFWAVISFSKFTQWTASV